MRLTNGIPVYCVRTIYILNKIKHCIDFTGNGGIRSKYGTDTTHGPLGYYFILCVIRVYVGYIMDSRMERTKWLFQLSTFPSNTILNCHVAFLLHHYWFCKRPRSLQSISIMLFAFLRDANLWIIGIIHFIESIWPAIWKLLISQFPKYLLGKNCVVLDKQETIWLRKNCICWIFHKWHPRIGWQGD